MPKSLTIDPTAMRQSGMLNAPSIPLNAYRSDPKREAELYGSTNLVRIYRDMQYLRAFETMLDQLKKEGNFAGIRYTHAGPAHLSIGQEAAAVGQCYHLGAEDLIFGSHRSHGEILAKGLSAIAKLDEAALQTIMEEYLDGAPLRVVEKLAPYNSVRALAIDYLLYGALAEIFGRDTGFNRGMGGSMHAFFPPFGIMPNNAIVGGSADIALGAALFKRINRKPGIVIANIGDASLACGPVWEAMVFAAMDQYHTLWPEEIGGAPPLLFNFMNNFYGMGGQPVGETMGIEVLARVGLGINPEAMHAERVDGFSPLAVADALARKRSILLAGQGPVLFDTVTYRFSGHSPSDASAYREREEIDRWRAQDSLAAFEQMLLEEKHLSSSEIEALASEIQDRLTRVLSAAISLQSSPRIESGATIAQLMFSNQRRERMAEREPDVLQPVGESRLQVTHAKHRFALEPDGRAHPRSQCLTYAEAIFEAMLHRFYIDPTMIAYGEENRDWGGAFAVYRGLTEALPYHRLFNSPISEAAIVGSAVGYALSGGRVVVELMYCDFMGRAGDEIFNQMAKWQAMSGGVLTMPMVLRVSVGNKYGAQHSQDWSALCAHMPGLQVFFPATPYDAKGMLNRALCGTDPVVFFESQRLYTEPEQFVSAGVPTDYYEVPLGEPALRRTGTDITIITIGATLYRALSAAEQLAAEDGLSAEVIDLRFLNPLNYTPLIESVKKTGRVLLASDACTTGSFLHTVASTLTKEAFYHLDAPPIVIGAQDWITPPAEMETLFFPQADWIVSGVRQLVHGQSAPS